MRASCAVAVMLVLGGGALSAQVKPAGAEPPASGAVGTWLLVEIDGQPLPYSPMHEGAPVPVQIMAAKLILRADGTMAQSMTYALPAEPARPPFTRDFTGAWSSTGADCVLTWDNAGQTPAKLEGQFFSYDNEGMVLRFKRQLEPSK